MFSGPRRRSLLRRGTLGSPPQLDATKKKTAPDLKHNQLQEPSKAELNRSGTIAGLE
jgi:hypothetical protein